MNALKIDKALSELLFEKIQESKAKLELLPKEAKNERKAVQIEIGMYNLFIGFGFLYHLKNGDTVEEQRKHVFSIREKMILREQLLLTFPKIKPLYEAADDSEKMRIIAALHCEMCMRHSFYTYYVRDLEKAKQCSDIEKAFEFRVKVAVLEDGFNIMEKWREENQIYYGMFSKE